MLSIHSKIVVLASSKRKQRQMYWLFLVVMLDHTLHAPQRPIVGFVVVHSIGTRTFWLCIKTSKMLGNVHSVVPEKISSRCQSSSKSMVGLAKAKESDPAVVLRGKRSSLLRWILPIVAWDSAATSSSKNPSTAAFLAILQCRLRREILFPMCWIHHGLTKVERVLLKNFVDALNTCSVD